jgi:hypothetical protein
VRNSYQFEKRGLLDLVLHAFVGVVAGKRRFADRVEEVRIEGGRVIDDVRPSYLGLDPARILMKIGAHPERDNVAALSQAGFEGNDFAFEFHWSIY